MALRLGLYNIFLKINDDSIYTIGKIKFNNRLFAIQCLG